MAGGYEGGQIVELVPERRDEYVWEGHVVMADEAHVYGPDSESPEWLRGLMRDARQDDPRFL